MPPTKITKAEYEAKFGVKPVVSTSTLDVTPTPIRITKAEYNAKFRPENTQGFVADVKSTVGDIKSTLNQGTVDRERIIGEVFNGQTTPAQGTRRILGKGLSTGITAVAQGVIGAGKAVLPQFIQDKIGGAVAGTSEAVSNYNKRFVDDLKVSEDPEQRKIGNQIEETVNLYQTDQAFKDEVDAAGGILQAVTSLVGIGPAKNAVVKTVDNVADVAQDASTMLKEVSNKYSVSRNDARVQNVVNEIEAIENKYAPTRRKADRDPVVNESRSRIALSNVLNNAVDEDGLIRTKTKGGAVDAYRAQTIDGVEDVVKKNLEVENKKVNLNELRGDMYDAVTKSGLEGADLTRAIKGIDAELQGLAIRADEFGDVLLSKIQDAKTSIYKHIDYTKPSGVTYRKSLARVYKETIENKSDLPVKEWNAELAKYYTDLDRLADLDGKRVKGGRLGKYTANIAGSAVGGVAGATAGAPGALVGGMLGGEIAGFIQGKAMAGTFKKGVAGEVPENQILKDAKARITAGTKDLTKPDAQVGAPKALMNDPDLPEPVRAQITKVEGQIKDNIKQQNAAIKAGDFTLVAALKDVYIVLVDRLKEVIADYRKNGIPLGMSIRKTVTPESVAKKSDPEDIKFLAGVIDDVKGARTSPEAGKILDAMGLGRATDDELVAFAKDVIDEADIAKNLEVKATAPTTLLEEAKGKSLDEFVEIARHEKAIEGFDQNTKDLLSLRNELNMASSKASQALTDYAADKRGAMGLVDDATMKSAEFQRLKMDFESKKDAVARFMQLNKTNKPLQKAMSEYSKNKMKVSKSQLEEIWNRANETKKYKSAEELPAVVSDLKEIYQMAETPTDFGNDMADMFIRQQKQSGNLPTRASTNAEEMLRNSQDFEVGMDVNKIVQTTGNKNFDSVVERKIKEIESGQTPLVFLDENNRIIDGNHAFLAYKKLGYKVIPAIKGVSNPPK